MHFILKTFLLILQLGFISHINGQKLCSFSDTVKNNAPNFIQHLSTSKCMKVSGFGFLPQSYVVINECSYWNTATTDQKIIAVSSPLNKTVLKISAGNNQFFCLSTKDQKLINDNCNENSFDQNWTFKPVKGRKGWFTIEQYSSKKCLIPFSRSTGSRVGLKPCNANETEQLWKLCS